MRIHRKNLHFYFIQSSLNAKQQQIYYFVRDRDIYLQINSYTNIHFVLLQTGVTFGTVVEIVVTMFQSSHFILGFGTFEKSMIIFYESTYA